MIWKKDKFDEHDDVGMEWLGSTSEILSTNGVDTSLSYLCRREYTIECNWKVCFFQILLNLELYLKFNLMMIFKWCFLQVFCDNYLDGGYHVPFAHKDLALGLKLDSYSTTVCMFHLTHILIKMFEY